MRVLLINKYHYLKGGAERAYFDTAHILAENGHSVAFFAMAHPKNEATEWDRFFVTQVDYHDQAMGWWTRFRAALRIIWNREAAAKLAALIREFRPEVAHLHNIYHQLSPSILWTLKKHHVRIVMTLHDYKLISPNYNLLVRGRIWDQTSGLLAILDRAVQDAYLKSFVCALEQWIHTLLGSYRQVDVFLAPSQFLITRFRAAGFHALIQHVVQPIRPFPGPPRVHQGTNLLCIGRLSTEKGVSTAIEASRLLSDTVPLEIMGSGPDESALRAQAADVSAITFLGHQSAVSWEDTLAGARAVVIPSIWYENMPYVLLEALSRGVPVIASRIGGLPERIREGENGFLFTPGDAVDLVRVIQTLLAHPDPAALSRAAYDSVSDARPDRYYQTLLELYRGHEHQ